MSVLSTMLPATDCTPGRLTMPHSLDVGVSSSASHGLMSGGVPVPRRWGWLTRAAPSGAREA
eukprot:688061-Prymnesium_polylepis.1